MTGVLLCHCQRKSDGPAWSEKIARSLPGVLVFPHARLCSADGISFAAARVKEKKLTRLLLAGCETLRSRAYAVSLSRATDIPASASDSVVLGPKASAPNAARAIRKAFDAVELVPRFPWRRSLLLQQVLIVGGGRAGLETARLAAGLGYPTTLIQKSLQALAAPPSGVEILPGTTLVSLTGRMGDFSARLSRLGGSEDVERRFGAVVIADETEPAEPHGAPFVAGRIIPLFRLEGHIESLPRREWPRRSLIVLDYQIDEDASSDEAALRAAVAVRQRFHSEVTVVLHDARVSSRGLETLYGEARLAGVTFLKHGGSPDVTVLDTEVMVRFADSVTGQEEEVSCDLAAVSTAGILAAREDALAAAAGVGMDACGRLQDNNVHLLPTQTGRAGVFVVGPRRGGPGWPGSVRDARDAAFGVHALLSRGKIVTELSNPEVDGEKCVLCLTCVRTCPFKAMRIDDVEKKAACIAESCRGCGICAAECPARAITLPAHSDQVLLARAGASR